MAPAEKVFVVAMKFWGYTNKKYLILEKKNASQYIFLLKERLYIMA